MSFKVTETPTGGNAVRSVDVVRVPKPEFNAQYDRNVTANGNGGPTGTSPSLESGGGEGYNGNQPERFVDDWNGTEPEGGPGAEGAGENLKSPSSFSQFYTYGDALRENLGPAYQSHKAEYDDILNQAKEHGVEITFREGTLAYEPSLTAGKPGRLILDPDASIGALRHEFKHLLDDAAMGHPGFQIMADRDAFWELERRGYMEELNLARQIKDTKAEKLILQEMQERMNEIFGGE